MLDLTQKTFDVLFAPNVTSRLLKIDSFDPKTGSFEATMTRLKPKPRSTPVRGSLESTGTIHFTNQNSQFSYEIFDGALANTDVDLLWMAGSFETIQTLRTGGPSPQVYFPFYATEQNPVG